MVANGHTQYLWHSHEMGSQCTSFTLMGYNKQTHSTHVIQLHVLNTQDAVIFVLSTQLHTFSQSRNCDDLHRDRFLLCRSENLNMYRHVVITRLRRILRRNIYRRRTGHPEERENQSRTTASLVSVRRVVLLRAAACPSHTACDVDLVLKCT